MKKGIIALTAAAFLASTASAAFAQVSVNSSTGRPNVPFGTAVETQAEMKAPMAAEKSAKGKHHKKGKHHAAKHGKKAKKAKKEPKAN